MAVKFTTAKIWNQYRCPLIDIVDKENVVHIYMMEYYTAIKVCNFFFCTKMNTIETITLTEMNQYSKGKYMFPLFCVK